MKKLTLLFLCALSLRAYAFPDMLRHGYINCTACHISPSGGGVLNQYGRSLSKELISTWSTEKEEGLFHGLIDTSKVDEWLAIGGDYRGVQVHQENERIKRGRWVDMQAGFELAIYQPNWAVVSFIGQYLKPNEWANTSPRYYAIYKPRDELYLRVGRFLPNFGINLPDHILSTRMGLGFGYGQERDTAEISWLGEEWNFIGSYYVTPEKLSKQNEKGWVLNIQKVFGEHYKAGVQYLSEKNDAQTRTIFGYTGALAWSEKFSTLIEVDQQITTTSGVDRKEIATMQRTAYEVAKGFHVAVLTDYSQSNLDVGSTKQFKYGPGVQWFPRPHFDVQAFWTREQAPALSEKEGDYAWLVVHYYL